MIQDRGERRLFRAPHNEVRQVAESSQRPSPCNLSWLLCCCVGMMSAHFSNQACKTLSPCLPSSFKRSITLLDAPLHPYKQYFPNPTYIAFKIFISQIMYNVYGCKKVSNYIANELHCIYIMCITTNFNEYSLFPPRQIKPMHFPRHLGVDLLQNGRGV